MNDHPRHDPRPYVPGKQAAVLFHHPAMAVEHIARFAFLFLGQIMSGAGHHDAVHRALDESGIHPRPPRECKEHHLETQIERINSFADALLAKFSEDQVIHASMSAIARDVLRETTMPAPAAHLTDAQLQSYLLCCSGASAQHLVHYSTYAEWHAHIGSCWRCEQRLRELITEPPT